MHEELKDLIACLKAVGMTNADIQATCMGLTPKQMDELSLFIIENRPTWDEVMAKYVEMVEVIMEQQRRLQTERMDVAEMKVLLQSGSIREIQDYLKTHYVTNERERDLCCKLRDRAQELKDAQDPSDHFPVNMPKTLHLIQGGNNCGELKCALGTSYHIKYYPLPLSYSVLPRSISKTELQRVNRAFRKEHNWSAKESELYQFLHPDLSKYDRVVVWWSKDNKPCAHLVLHLVCRFYPDCELYSCKYNKKELADDLHTPYPDGIKLITPEERADYAAQYDEFLNNDTHLRIYADEQHQQIISIPEDTYDQELLSLCKDEVPYLRVCGELLKKHSLDLWFSEARIYWLHQNGKLQISDVKWFLNQFSLKNMDRDRNLLTIKAI